jgi:Secretion system C-terminal sorting domain
LGVSFGPYICFMRVIGMAVLMICVQASIALAQNTEDVFKELKRETAREKLRVHSVEDVLRLSKIPLSNGNDDAISKKVRGYNYSSKKVSTVTSSSVSEGEAYITIDKNNTNRLAVGFMDNSDTRNPGILYRVYTSNDGGTTFAASPINTNGYNTIIFPGYIVGGGGDPVLEYDKDGNLHLSWIYLLFKVNTGTGSIDSIRAVMFHAVSNDHGASFVATTSNRFIAQSEFDPVAFTNTGELVELPGSPGFHDRQWFALDNSTGPYANSLYCSFVYFPSASEPNSAGGGSIKKLVNSSGAWTNKVKAIEGPVQFNNVRVDKQGTLHMTGADMSVNQVVYVKSTDGGATFSAPIAAATGTNLFGNQNNGYIHDRENSATNMEVDGQNNVHIVWSDFNTTTDSNFVSKYARKLSASSSFTAPQDLRTIFNTNLRALMPTVSTSNNNVTIGAYFIEPATKRSRYRIINSRDNGVTWDSPLTVSTDSFLFNSSSNTGKWFGDYFNAVRTDEKMYNIWSDGRGASGPKMYISIISEWTTGVQEFSPINDELSIGSPAPNPASNEFILAVNSKANNSISATITSINGAVISSQKFAIINGSQNIKFDASQLASGLYAINITTQDGTKYCRKLVKQ